MTFTWRSQSGLPETVQSPGISPSFMDSIPTSPPPPRWLLWSRPTVVSSKNRGGPGVFLSRVLGLRAWLERGDGKAGSTVLTLTSIC